jgi:hypothetical protein
MVQYHMKRRARCQKRERRKSPIGMPFIRFEPSNMFAILTVSSSYIVSMITVEYLSNGTVWKTPPRLVKSLNTFVEVKMLFLLDVG